MIWGPFQVITNIHGKPRKQLWSLPCQVLLRCDLLLSAEPKSACPHLPPTRTNKQFGATPCYCRVLCRVLIHASFVPGTGPRRISFGRTHKATVLNRVSQAALMPFQLGRTAYRAILFSAGLCLEHDEPHCTDPSWHPWEVGLPSCVTYKETKDQRDVLAGSTSCLGFISESVNCSNCCSVILDKVI